MWKCPSCGLLFLSPVPPHTELQKIYGAHYYCGQSSGFGYRDYDRDKEPMKKMFARFLDDAEHLAPRSGKRLLDIGASTGFFLAVAQGMGWKAEGIEISEYAAAIARKRGYSVECGTIEVLRADHAYDVISCWDVFEHIPDPHSFLTAARRLLAPNGLLLINTPTSSSLWSKLWGRHWNAILPPEHVLLYNEYNLSLLLEQHGFRVLSNRKIGKKFRLLYILHILARWSNFPIIGRLADQLEHTCLARLCVFLNLRDNVFLCAQTTGV